MQAHIFQGALENEGIESLLHNENYERALQVLRDNQSFPEDLKCCPYCGSADITFKLRSDRRMRAACAAVLSLLVMAPPGDNHWPYKCNRCKALFDKPVSADYKREEESRI